MLAALALFVVAPAAHAGEYSESWSTSSDSLTIHNLIGEVQVTGGGSEFEVTVHVRGADASPGSITLDGSSNKLEIVFPESKRFVYPKLGSGKVSFSPSNNERGSWLSNLFGSMGGGNIEVNGSGRGTEIWADLEIRVPDGAEFVIYHGVGDLNASGIEGEVTLDTSSGRVNVDGVDGSLLVDTGSGAVSVRNSHGEVTVDTGSGHVDISDSDGDSLLVDTGSGQVTLSSLRFSGNVNVDTGSGRVTLEDVEGDEFVIDTGSGRVNASGLRAEAVSIDTGSGSVELELTEMGGGNFEIDTGSGGITLALPSNASAKVHAESNSGVDLQLDDAKNVRQDDDEIDFVVGGGNARVNLETGSGRVKIIRSN
jgi:DUF4097 and DUF4098 domain-containing protein YvlB